MAEYYRILSYLYRYDKKKKIDCKGFVKAEQKKNGLKITLQIDDERLPENVKLALCFYNRQEDIHNEELPDKKMTEEDHHVGRKAGGQNFSRWRMQQLTLLEALRPQEETILFYPTDQLPDHFDIRKQYGIILFYQEFFFYGSVWVGEEIPIEELLTVYRKSVHLPDQEDDREEASAGQEYDGEEVSVGQEDDKKEASSNQEDDREEDSSNQEDDREEEFVVQEDDNSAGEQECIQNEDSTTTSVWKEDWDEELSVEKKDRVSIHSVDMLEKMWINTEKTAKPVDNIFNPAFRSGYRIDIEQLREFSPAQSLSENQFLAKSYAVYHHLLIGKVNYGGVERYCVGVPGIYENREKYMAQLYQFPIFLSLTENRIKTGGFGYWLHLLSE